MSKILPLTFCFFLVPVASDFAAADEIAELKKWLAKDTTNRGDIASQPFAKNPINKKQSEQALILLWKDHRQQLQENRKQEWKDKVIKLDKLEMKFDYKIFGDAPKEGRSLFISMHGGGGAPARVNEQQWRNQIKLYQPKEGVYLAPRAPTNTWNLWHQGHIDKFFTRIIEDAIVFENVNPNRVYIMGYSAGGDGVYQLAPRMADQLAAAAMMAGHPNNAQPFGLRNIGFALYMGGKDSRFSRNKVAEKWKTWLAELKEKDPDGYQHDVVIYPEYGHWMQKKDAAAVPWMAKFTRDPFPKKIVWHQSGTTHDRFYWLAVDPQNRIGGSQVIASRAGQSIVIESAEKIKQLKIRLNDAMINLDRPIQIKCGDKRFSVDKVERNIGLIAQTLTERGDPKSVYSAELTIDLEKKALVDTKKLAQQPNIIFIMLDDLGKEWVGSYGAEKITPNIDRLAAGGMQFNNVYCMPQCTPTRLTLLTGQYPFRHGWVNHWDVPRWGGGCSYDPKLNPSVALLMKKAGYKTAVAGKWQIDDFRQEPKALQAAGFDRWSMWTGYEGKNPPSGKRYWDPYVFTNDGSKTYEKKFGPDLFTEFVRSFIRDNRDEPFFIYFPMALPHGPLVATPDEPNASEKMEKHRAMVKYIDKILGQIVEELDQNRLREKTIIIWSTDNGTGRGITGSINGKPVRGGKAQTTENGICVPFIVNCPGTVPAGIESDALVDFTDLLPTFVDLAGGQVPAEIKIDGHSFKDVILGRSKKSRREWIMAMGGRNEAKLTDKGVENKYWFRDRVIRDERFKLYIGTDRQPEKLFDLQADPFEQINLITSTDSNHQAAIKRLRAPIAKMPAKDNDPVYEPLPYRDWYRKPVAKSHVWKTGYPGETDNSK